MRFVIDFGFYGRIKHGVVYREPRSGVGQRGPRRIDCLPQPEGAARRDSPQAFGFLGYFVSRRKTATVALISARAGHAIVT